MGKKKKCEILPREGTPLYLLQQKGGAVVIADTENYMKNADIQWFDKKNYKILQTDHPTLQHNKMVDDALGLFKNKNLLS